MDNKYIFLFQKGMSILVPAKTKIDAIKVFEKTYSKLFEAEKVTIITLGLELDKDGNVVFESE